MGSGILTAWRTKQGLTMIEVDKKMNWSRGTTSKYERICFLRVPCCDLCKLVALYDVPLTELYRLLDSEIKRWRKR